MEASTHLLWYEVREAEAMLCLRRHEDKVLSWDHILDNSKTPGISYILFGVSETRRILLAEQIYIQSVVTLVDCS